MPEVYHPPIEPAGVYRHSIKPTETQHSPNEPFRVPHDQYPAQYQHEAMAPPQHQPPNDDSTFPHDTLRKMVCGIRVWVLVVLSLVVLIAIVGGVLGGLLGSRSKSKILSSEPQTTAGATGVVTVTVQASISTASATATVSPTATSLARDKFKFASIAAAKCQNVTYLQVFYLESTALKASIWGDSGWKYLGDLNPSIAPRLESPLAAISWREDGAIQVSNSVLYYALSRTNLVTKSDQGVLFR